MTGLATRDDTTGPEPEPAHDPGPVQNPGPAPEPTFEDLASAVDEAVRATASLEGNARKVAEAVKESIEAAHRAALVTIVRRLKASEQGRALLYELVDDPLIHLMFALHGIIRPDPMVEAQAALDLIRPGLQSHGGDCELVRIQDGVAHVRLSGACNGCSMSSVTMRTTVEQALKEGCRSVSSVEVLASEPSPTVIPLSSLRRRSESPDELAAQGWVRTSPAAEIADGKITSLRLTTAAGVREEVVVVRIGANMTAFRDECAHQGMPISDADLDVATGTLTCQWHGFCYEALSGDCTSAPGAALEQLPLRVDDGVVWIRVQA